MAIPKVQRATPETMAEMKPLTKTEQKTTQDTKSAQHQTTFDTPQAKAEASKNLGTTQKSTPAGETQTYHAEGATRTQLENKPPAEEKAQYKDQYNPASTILRSQETEKQEPRDDQKVTRDKKDKEGGRGGRQRRALRAESTAKRLTAPIRGSEVLGGQSQDMFVPAGSEVQVRQRTTLEVVREYSLGAIGSAIFTTVTTNVDAREETKIGANMQKALLDQISDAMADTPDILQEEFRHIVREVVQGALQAAHQNEVRLQDMIKMIVSAVMAISPHDDDPKIMAEVAKIIAGEIIWGKVNIGYSMKLGSYALGGALFMLSVYYKNFQKRLNFNKDVEQKLKVAMNEGIWEATGEITGYSESHARANTQRFVQGRIEEEKAFQRNLVRGILMMPLRKLQGMGFVNRLMQWRKKN